MVCLLSLVTVTNISPPKCFLFAEFVFPEKQHAITLDVKQDFFVYLQNQMLQEIQGVVRCRLPSFIMAVIQSLKLVAHIYIPNTNIGWSPSGFLLSSRYKLPIRMDGQALNIIIMSEEEFLAGSPQVMVALCVHNSHHASVVHHLGFCFV